jgi:LmbE family N-acetylglucosaminyl deacetylase
MLECALSVAPTGSPLRILCLGAHADDLEIGCGGLLLKLVASATPLDVAWVVFSANGSRRREAMDSADALLERVLKKQIALNEFRDGFFPYTGAAIKEYFETLRSDVVPDVILTHYRHDLHQDHRLISELTWNTFRNHLILEYEVPKYDGDFGSPNVFVQLDEGVVHRKVDCLLRCFTTQECRRWFSADLFRSVMRLRGLECNSPSGFAEAFYAPKLGLAIPEATRPTSPGRQTPPGGFERTP